VKKYPGKGPRSVSRHICTHAAKLRAIFSRAEGSSRRHARVAAKESFAALSAKNPVAKHCGSAGDSLAA